MDSQLILIKAIRSGRLSDVQAALDAGALVELQDGQGDPGLPMGIACFMGFVDIVRELAKRGWESRFPRQQCADFALEHGDSRWPG